MSLHTTIQHGSDESKEKFLTNVLSISPSISALCKAIEDEPDLVFAETAKQACDNAKERHSLRTSPLKRYYK